MYKTIIELKEHISEEDIKEIRRLCIEAHDNRAGKVEIKELSDKTFVFEGEEKDFGCLNLGFLTLNKIKQFKEAVKTWYWEDEDPADSCNLAEALSRPIYS